MMQVGTTFDPRLGAAEAFIYARLVPEALRRVYAENAPPGALKRLRKGQPKPRAAVDIDDAPDVEAVGYASAGAVEAACDSHIIWSRATVPTRQVLERMMLGENQTEIAAQIGYDRFKVIRLVKELQSQFAEAA
jgi:hypothetical protein